MDKQNESVPSSKVKSKVKTRDETDSQLVRLPTASSCTKKMQSETEHSKTSQNSDWLNVINDLIQNELKCAICQEVAINTINLNCSHIFCDCCIDEWVRTSNCCPVCRVKIQQRTRVLALDNLLNRIYEQQDKALFDKRNELIQERVRLKKTQQERIMREQRNANITMTRRNIRLLHEPLGDIDLAMAAQNATSGIDPVSPFILSIENGEYPALIPELGRHFEPPFSVRRQMEANGPMYTVTTEQGTVLLQLQTNDFRMTDSNLNREPVARFLRGVNEVIDRVYRLQSRRERNRRRQRIERIRTLNDNELVRQRREQERTRRAQRLARRDQMIRFDLGQD